MKLITIAAVSILCLSLEAQNPRILVDINFPDRHESEVNEPGYLPWPLQRGGASMKAEGVTFTIAGAYAVDWYKAGVQAPYYARLANDALITGAEATLTLSGLPEGTHTLLTFHNSIANPDNYASFSPMDIYLGDSLIVDDLIMTNRVLDNSLATTAYMVFKVNQGEDVTITFTPEKESDAERVVACLCGFELNTPNSIYQATRPIPADGDEHVATDSGRFDLSWTPAPGATGQDIYFGTDRQALREATTDSPEFMAHQADTTYFVSDLYSLEDYFWRVDQHDSSGTVTMGDIWYFKSRQNAFPDAEGYGRYALGGRKGQVVEVTNLNDAGPGSFREAIENDIGPRTIIFRVSGVITLQSRLSLKSDYVTVAGQTAPGKGICIRQAPFGLSGVNDVIVRHMRVRLGSGDTYDGMGMSGSDHSILDHCSISWTIDEGFSSRSGKNITLQKTLISEALNVAGHSNYPEGSAHGFAASIGGDIGSFHHNLLAHCAGRNWSLAGGLDADGNFAGRLDIFNNVVYNWNYRVTDGGAHEVNFVGNYYKKGAAWDHATYYALKAEYEKFPGTQQYYFAGNIMGGSFDESNQERGRIYTGSPQGYPPWVDEPFFPSKAQIHSARTAYKLVLSDVGATQPVFDDHDRRIIRETLDSTYTYVGSETGLPGLPDSHEDVGGWEEYPALLRSADWDSDRDGMPGWWENALGLNPESPEGDLSDSHGDPDRNGYTNLEEYLDWMANPHYFIAEDSVLECSIPSLFCGFEFLPVYIILPGTSGTTTLVDDSIARFTPLGAGLDHIDLMVRDATGDTLIRRVGIFTGTQPADEAYAGPTSVEQAPGKEIPMQLSCYPNPAGNEIFIRVKCSPALPSDLRVYDMAGKTVCRSRIMPGELDVPLRLDLSVWSPGLYLLSLKTDREVLYHKFTRK